MGLNPNNPFYLIKFLYITVQRNVSPTGSHMGLISMYPTCRSVLSVPKPRYERLTYLLIVARELSQSSNQLDTRIPTRDG